MPTLSACLFSVEGHGGGLAQDHQVILNIINSLTLIVACNIQ